MNQEELEDWSLRVMQTLQDFCDEAQVAAGNPDGDDQLHDVRALMAEYERISKGIPTWQSHMDTLSETESTLLSSL